MAPRPPTREAKLEKASTAQRESKYVEFRDRFDPADETAWLELVKDVVALANAGGGVVVFGVRADGASSGNSNVPDRAALVAHVGHHTGEEFHGFELVEVTRADARVPALLVSGASEAPLVFADDTDVFTAGAIFMRHGRRSEPARPQDIRAFVDRRVGTIRRRWLGGIRKVVTAPEDAIATVYRATESDETGEPVQIQLTTDPGAPVYGRVDVDRTHPYRQTEVIEELRRRLPGVTVNAYRMLCVRRTYGIDPERTPELVHRPRFGSPQYSEAFVEWIAERYAEDAGFFEDACREYQRSRR